LADSTFESVLFCRLKVASETLRAPYGDYPWGLTLPDIHERTFEPASVAFRFHNGEQVASTVEMEEERIRILSAEEAVPDDLGSRHRKLHVAKKGNSP
jgi:hypothetical protein